MDNAREKRPERRGPVDGQSNGTPARGLIDDAAVERLESASALFQQEGRERDVIDAALPLLRVFETNEDYDHLVDCLFLIGEACYHLADWPNAEKYMGRAADLGYRYFAEEMSSYPLKVVGEAQYEQGKEEEALATFRWRLHILRRENDVEELGGALFDVGGMLVNTGRYSDAVVMLTEARRVLGTRRAELTRLEADADDEQVVGLKVDEAECLYHIAIAHFRRDELDEALAFLRRAYDHFTALPEETQEELSDRIVAVLDDLVQVSEGLEDFAAADVYRQRRDALNL